LQALPPGAGFEDDKVLFVWAELPFFGINRDDIGDYLDKEQQ
jgi:hypothetical protein